MKPITVKSIFSYHNSFTAFLTVAKNSCTKYSCSLLILCIAVSAVHAQSFLPPSPQYKQGRMTGIIVAEAVAGTAITVGLNYLWYKKFPHSRFHFFNDNHEWLGVDKVGHATTAYNIAVMQNDLLRWAGAGPHVAMLAGGLTSLGFMTMIEILDGHSAKWGFSGGDMLANTAGCLLFAAQQYAWGEQRLQLRFSYHPTIYPKYNPGELGRNWIQRILKDYNGQTYWLSVNLPAFAPKVPAWMSLSFGYGADGMTGASANPTSVQGVEIPSFTRSRQYYFSAGPSLANYTPQGFAVGTLKALNTVFPAPAPTLRFQKGKKMHFYPLYF